MSEQLLKVSPVHPELVEGLGQALLDVKNLSISFGGHEVVHGIDFSIAPGEKLALGKIRVGKQRAGLRLPSR